MNNLLNLLSFGVILFGGLFCSPNLFADEKKQCNPNLVVGEVNSKTKFCGYFETSKVKSNLLERQAYIETIKLILKEKASEVWYAIDSSGKVTFRLEMGVLTQVPQELHEAILSGEIVEFVHTHPFGLNISNPSESDRDSYSIWAKENSKIIFKIIYSPTLYGNVTKESLVNFLKNADSQEIMTTKIIPQFAD